MIKNIVKDTMFLSFKSTPYTVMDKQVVIDLKDTLKANRLKCVGMAANMIGYLKRVIIFDDMGKYTIMINPSIISKKDQYETIEGCLCLNGERKTIRYRNIIVEYTDESGRIIKKAYNGYSAQIIQHECDHLNGIII